MNEIALAKAKAEFSALIEAVERGESFTITKRGAPVATLRPTEDAEAARRRKAEAAFAALKAWRETQPKRHWTVDDILSARDEGRRY